MLFSHVGLFLFPGAPLTGLFFQFFDASKLIRLFAMFGSLSLPSSLIAVIQLGVFVVRPAALECVSVAAIGGDADHAACK